MLCLDNVILSTSQDIIPLHRNLKVAQQIPVLCVWPISHTFQSIPKRWIIAEVCNVMLEGDLPIHKYISFDNSGLEVWQFNIEYIIHVSARATWNNQQKLTALNSPTRVIIHSIVLINHLADTVGLEKYHRHRKVGTGGINQPSDVCEKYLS